MPSTKQMDEWTDKLVEMRKKGMDHKEIIQYIQENTEVNLFVYFVLNRNHNAVKIGFSHNPEKRLGGLKDSMLDKLELLGYISCGENARKVEKELHRTFKQFHIKGEWFRYELFLKESIEKILEGEKK